MPWKSTPELTHAYERAIQDPAGVHDAERSRTYLFKDLFADLPSNASIFIGRSSKCAIQMRTKSVSAVHASIKRTSAGHFLLTECLNTNGVYVNGVLLNGPAPVVLEAYTRIRLGAEAILEICDEEKLLMIAATTEPRYHKQAAICYGNNELAGKRIQRGRETVRRKTAECNAQERA